MPFRRFGSTEHSLLRTPHGLKIRATVVHLNCRPGSEMAIRPPAVPERAFARCCEQ
jgi:hypothetical protein